MTTEAELEIEELQTIITEKELEIEELRTIIDDAIEKLDQKEEEFKRTLSSKIQSLALEFTCTICQELFVTATTLPCAHSFCELCLCRWLRGNSSSRKSCPICRRRIRANAHHSVVLDNAIDKIIETIGGEQKERRIELIAQREEQKREEEGSESMNDVRSVIYQVEHNDASEYREASHRNNPGNSRGRRGRNRRAPSQSSRYRYGLLRPSYLTSNNIDNFFRSIDRSESTNSDDTVPPDQSDEVPVIDLTTNNSYTTAQNHPDNDADTITVNNDADIITVTVTVTNPPC